MPDSSHLISVPVGKLGIIPLQSSKPLGEKVDSYISRWRADRQHEHKDNITFSGYEKNSYILKSDCPRFGSGEAKGTLSESVRGTDLYLLVDVMNHSIEYKVCGRPNMMSPDDHFADLKRVIAAIGGKSTRITVIMPFLYESRQHKRSGRESLDCALALQELVSMGVDYIITFDAHDPRVQNAIPLTSFENIMPTYQFIKTLLRTTPDLELDKDHMMVISPDEGAMHRAIYFANHFGVDVGMFYKRRDYSRIENGRNPIVAHEYLGKSVEGMDIFVADDIISSGQSVLDLAYELKEKKANKIYAYATYGLFTDGLEKFDKAYEEGYINGILGTNLTYRTPELLKREWFMEVDVSKYIAYFIAAINHDISISKVIDPHEKIHQLLQKYNQK